MKLEHILTTGGIEYYSWTFDSGLVRYIRVTPSGIREVSIHTILKLKQKRGK